MQQILFKEIKQISLLIFDANEEGPLMIERILFEIDGGNILLIKAEPNFDEIEVEIHQEYQIQKTEPLHKVITLDSNSSHFLSNCINKSIIWFWTLTNNQNYHDGVEMELQNKTERLSIRFLAEGSAIKVGVIENIK